MNFRKVVPLVPPPPHFLEITVGSLGGGGECVGTLNFVCVLFGPPPLLSHPRSVPHALFPKFSLISNLIFSF